MKAGRVVEIPDIEDSPPFFTFRRSRGDHMEERLLLLVTPAPLAGIEITRNAQAISREQIEEWERKWSVPARRLESMTGAGRG